MRERIDLQARWSDRKDSLEECTGHTVECLRQLAVCDETFGQWFQGGNSRKEALGKRFEPTFESCRDLLTKGRNRRDKDQSVIETLGFYAGLWNGLEDDSAVSIRFHTGAYPAVPRMPNPNDCVVELPYGGAAGNRIFQTDKLRQLMGTVVVNWDPDWARVSTYQMRNALYPEIYQGVEVGWLTYLSNRYGPLPKLPDDCEVTQVEGLGSLILIKKIDRLTALNPVHVEAAMRLSNSLNAAGLLTPTPPQVAA